eukprot:g3002.t1
MLIPHEYWVYRATDIWIVAKIFIIVQVIAVEFLDDEPDTAGIISMVRENTSALHGKGVLRGPIVADFHKEQGFFHLHFRKMLHASGDTSVLDKKKLIFAASFYVEITSYAIGELPHEGTTKGLVQKYLGYSKEAEEEESASKTE